MAQLTVATINLRNKTDRWLERRHLLVAQLVDAKPDLVSMQEISFPIGQGRWLCSQVNIRVSGTSAHPYQLIQKRKRHLINGFHEGIGVLSRLPVVYHDLLALGYGGRLALRVNVEVSINQSIDFVAVHLHHISRDKEAREEQVRRLCGWLNVRRRNPRQIVAGDFNEVPTGLAIQTMKQGFRSAYADVHGHEPLATFPTALLVPPGDWAGCLDYIFLSPAIGRVVSASLFCDKPSAEDDTLFPSDHVGLIASVEV